MKFDSKKDAIDCIEKIMKTLDISKEDLENAKSTIQAASFTSACGANNFCRTHDAIKIDYLCGSKGRITYIVTYKE